MSAPSDNADILVVIPCLNEERHLEGLLRTLLADAGAPAARIVVADGGSTDRSVKIVQRLAAENPRVSLLRNPGRIQSAAVNLAMREFGAHAEYLIRVDAHARYPEDYVSRLIAIAREEGADAVTVAMIAEAPAQTCFQIANAAAQNSVLGAGGSAHRKAGGRQWVDHGHHALFRAGTFRAAGGYNETFSHNEDAELDLRITKLGGRILLAGDLTIGYFPRTSARALFRQYFKFGHGRARTLLLHREKPKPRQLAPVIVAPAVMLAALALLSAWSPWWALAAMPAAIWLTACLLFGVLLGLRLRKLCPAAAGLPAAIIHLGWSFGFWSRLLENPPAAERPGASAEQPR